MKHMMVAVVAAMAAFAAVAETNDTEKASIEKIQEEVMKDIIGETNTNFFLLKEPTQNQVRLMRLGVRIWNFQMRVCQLENYVGEQIKKEEERKAKFEESLKNRERQKEDKIKRAIDRANKFSNPKKKAVK